jgi:hypothetical protein
MPFCENLASNPCISDSLNQHDLDVMVRFGIWWLTVGLGFSRAHSACREALQGEYEEANRSSVTKREECVVRLTLISRTRLWLASEWECRGQRLSRA